MLSLTPRNRSHLWIAIFLLWTVPSSFAVSPEEMTTAQQWLAAKFLGKTPPERAASYLAVYTQAGNIQKNRVQGHRFRIAGQEYSRGLHFPSDGKVRVFLPSPAQSFESAAGVDSNDIGYYSNVGRGAVVASVVVDGKQPFRSQVLQEGMPAIPIRVALDNATQFDLSIEDGGGGTVFGNHFDQADWADARVVLANGETVWLDDLPIGPPPAPFIAEVPFSFRYNSRPSGSLLRTWEVARSSRRLDSCRTEHVLTYTDPVSSLVVRAVAIEYGDFPVVEWTLYFKNTGDAPTPIIEDIQALDTRFERNDDGEFILHHSKGSPATPTDFEPLTDQLQEKADIRMSAAGGRPTSTDLCYFNIEQAGQGVIVGLGWPGQWAARFTRDHGVGLQVRAGQELTHFKLLPGEEARSPLVALMFYRDGWISGQNLWRRWMIAHNLPRPGGKLPAPLLSTGTNGFTIEMQGANEQNEKEFMQQYRNHGWKFDAWWMDAGWYRFTDGWWNTGTWVPDPARFPRGLRPVSDAAHTQGARTILWFEPERVTPGSWLWENHPEWLLGKEGDNKLLNLGDPEVRKWLTGHIDQLLTTEGIDIYRQDFNFDPLDIWRANDAADRQGITEIRHVTGYLEYWDELRRRHPDMLIDTCAGGGRRDDLETLRRAVPLWRSDYGLDDPTAQQDLTYGLALWIPFFGTGIRSSNPYSFRSTMAPAIGMGADPRSKNVDFRALLQLTAEWRQVAPFYYGDYYPLTPYTTDDTAWVAWQFNRPENGDGMVQAFRRSQSSIEMERLKLYGLDPAAEYQMSVSDTLFTGRELAEKGLPITIKDPATALLITYRRAGETQHRQAKSE